jgi:uncharacterized protein (TIGR02118 family)
MAAVVILYTPPEKVEHFEHRYHADYLPLIRSIPVVSRLTSKRIIGGPFGDPPYYRVETWHLSAGADPSDVFQNSVWRAAPEIVGFALGLATPMFIEEPDGER